ncbi:hypothetical protein [Nocardioides sp. YIM 152588]|uniref:hypothetical protein n=1 Tax=Nocardioides sp. YIM 152588 TaxID=3158259 RepID=UPI0032E4B1D8
MTEMISPTSRHSGHHLDPRDAAAPDHTPASTTALTGLTAAQPTQDRRSELRSRHARGLTTLMAQRSDLRGVHALADFVDDAVRWSA